MDREEGRKGGKEGNLRNHGKECEGPPSATYKFCDGGEEETVGRGMEGRRMGGQVLLW